MFNGPYDDVDDSDFSPVPSASTGLDGVGVGSRGVRRSSASCLVVISMTLSDIVDRK